MLVKKLIAGANFVCLSLTLFSQSAVNDSIKPVVKPVFTCSADAFYRMDPAGTAANNKTSFTNSNNSFELGMASVKMEHTTGKVGLVADVGFGKRAEEFSYADDRTRFIIKQLNLSYSLKNGLKFTLGSWATHVGYELVDAYSNRNYSMAYLFSYGPFFHTGLKAEKTFGKSSLMLGLANPTDLKSTTLNSKYAIAQFSTALADDALKLYLNFQGGKPNDTTRVTQLDLVATYAISDKWSLAFDGSAASFAAKIAEGDFGDAKTWWGAAAYINADPKPWLGLCLRSEYFSDQSGLNVFSLAPEGGATWANTLSFNFKMENLVLIPEIRYENASEAIYLDKDAAPDKSALSFLLAAVYKF